MSSNPGDFSFARGDSSDPVDLDTVLMVADSMPLTRQGLELLTAALQQIHQDGADAGLEYGVRLRLVSFAEAEGRYRTELENATWCVEHNEADPQAFPRQEGRYDLLNAYARIPRLLMASPEHPRAQVLQALDDLQRRYEAEGLGTAAVLRARFSEAFHSGHTEEAEAWFRQLSSVPPDEPGPCEACARAETILFTLEQGEREAALAAFDEFTGQELSCDREPETLMSHLLLPLLQAGRGDDAATAHRQGYRLVRDRPDAVRIAAEHAQFCALTGNHARALTLIQRHLPMLGNTDTPPASRLAAMMPLAVACDVISGNGHGQLPVHRSDAPELEAVFGPGQSVLTVIGLASALRAAARRLAEAFDERNGTRRHQRLLSDAHARVLEATPLPLQTPESIGGGAQRPGSIDPARVAVPAAPTDVDGWLAEAAWAGTSSDRERRITAVEHAAALDPTPCQRLELYSMVATAAFAESDPQTLEEAVQQRVLAYRELGLEEAAVLEAEHGPMLAGVLDQDQAVLVRSILDSATSDGVKARLQADLALHLLHAGEQEAALQTYLLAADLAQAADDQDQVRAALVGACWAVPIEAEGGELQAELLAAAEEAQPWANQLYDVAYLRAVDALATRQDPDAVLAASSAALELALRHRAVGPLRQISRFRAEWFTELKRHAEAAAAFQVHVQALEDLGLDPEVLTEVDEARSLLRAGAVEAAFEVIDAARDHLSQDETATPGQWATTERCYGQVTLELGFTTTAVEAFDRCVQHGEAALDEAPEVEDAQTAALEACQAARTIVDLAERAEQTEDVRNFGERALALATALQHAERGLLAITSAQVGRAWTRLGDETGLRLLSDAEEIAREDGEGWFAAEILDSRARGLMELGRSDEAPPLLLKAADEYSAVDDPVNAALSEYAVAHVLQQQGNDEEALSFLSGALDRVQEEAPLRVRTAIGTSLAELLEKLGREAEAQQVRDRIRT